jgi:hypothetical protein
LKNSFQIIIFLLSINVFSQGDFKVITEDFDNDGALEELIVNSYLGVIENAILTYDQGEKTCTLNIEPQKRHPSLINTVPLCDDLLKPQYKKNRSICRLCNFQDTSQ